MSERNARRLLRLVGDLLVVAQAEAGRLGLTADERPLGADRRTGQAAGRPPTPPASPCGRPSPNRSPSPPTANGSDRSWTTSSATRSGMRGTTVRSWCPSTGTGTRPAWWSPIQGRESRTDELPTSSSASTEARAVSSPGTGLGLSICQLIADAHDGRMEVSTGSGGAAFTLVLRPRQPSWRRRPHPERGHAESSPIGE